jgi:GNAT superfamily N-acetyltransferase
MSFRRSPKDFERGKIRNGNKNAMRRLVLKNKPTGILGLLEGKAIAWCALAPREDLIRLEKSRVHKRIDDTPVWSIPCFFVDRKFRRKGVSVAMLRGIIEYARAKHISVLEAYPAIPTQGRLPDAFAWIGLYTSFKRAGFKIVDRTSKHRPMVRYRVDAS